jgi:hypothetical protein
MHLLGCANDGIDGACLNTQGAANAGFWIDPSNWTWPFNSALWVNGASLII